MMQQSRKVLTENKHDLRDLKLACVNELSKIKRVSQVQKNRIIIEKMQREEFPLSFSEIDEMQGEFERDRNTNPVIKWTKKIN